MTAETMFDRRSLLDRLEARPARRLSPRAVAAATLVVALAMGAAALEAADKRYTPEELLQPFLGPELSQWLVGPVARLATEDEIDRFLRLDDDPQARRFIDEFWARRDPDPARDGNPVLELYESRAVEADKKFGEAAVAGRRTDRGTIHILYGEPESVEYEEFRDVSGPDVELWRYPKKAEPGLDGKRPERVYRFAKIDDLTRFYSARDAEDPRRRPEPQPGFPSGGPSDPGEPFPGDPPRR
jgi:GWxTD domain-containing protein